MTLWTWQADEVNPIVADIDPRRPGSYYDTNPPFRPAFERLWEMLRTDQLLWCFIDEAEAKQAHWSGRRLWSLDVPENSIVAIIDPGVWEFILESKAVPPHYRMVCTVWAQEAIRRGIDIADHEDQKLREYHETPAPRGDWWLSLFLGSPDDRGWSSKWVNNAVGGEIITNEILLRRPVPKSWMI